MAIEPRHVIEQLESNPRLPAGTAERMDGYGVMGLPFRSGHILALRRFTASSIGPDYTAVWHRTPDGVWEFFMDTLPEQSCPRYFGANARRSLETEIVLDWCGPYQLHLAVPGVALEWDVAVAPSTATRLMNALMGAVPAGAWRRPPVLCAHWPVRSCERVASGCRGRSQTGSDSSPIRA